MLRDDANSNLVVLKVLRWYWSFFMGNIVWSLLNNIAQSFYLFNVDLWLIDNFYEKNNLCNVVLTMLGQYCVGILSSQCCLNTSKTLHQKIIGAMFTKGLTNTFLQENNLYNVVLISLSQYCTGKNLV